MMTSAHGDGEAVELLQALIRNACINDGSCNVREEPNADLVAGHLEGSGFDVEVFDAAPGRRSVAARLAGTDPDAPTMMLLGHTDVVPVVTERWREDPFGGELIDGEVWGRGALDMLGHVATMTLAAREHARHGRHRGGDVVVAMVADEEALGTLGMAWLLEHHPDAFKADWVVTETGGLPSGPAHEPRLSVLAAEKGVWRLRLHVRGEPGHSSMPFGSVNALEVAAEVIGRLSRVRPEPSICEPWRAFVRAGWPDALQEAALDEALIDDVLPRLHPFPARVANALTRMTIVPTGIEAVMSWNTVPSAVIVEVDARTLPGQGLDDVLDVIRAALDGLEIHIDVVTGSPASSSPAAGRFWDLLGDAARVQMPQSRLIPTMAPGATDARFLRARGATAYGFGLSSASAPISEIPQMLHGDNERVDVESLRMMQRLWGDLLTMFSECTRGRR